MYGEFLWVSLYPQALETAERERETGGDSRARGTPFPPGPVEPTIMHKLELGEENRDPSQMPHATFPGLDLSQDPLR